MRASVVRVTIIVPRKKLHISAQTTIIFCQCRNCRTAHKALRISRNHKISNSNVSGQLVSTPNMTCNIFCSCNIYLKVTVYCEDHGDVMCMSCEAITQGKSKTPLVSEKCATYPTTRLTAVAEKAKVLETVTDSFLKEIPLDREKLATMKGKCKNDIMISELSEMNSSHS